MEFKECAETIKANPSKDQKEILSRFISALPREVLKKLFAVVLEQIIKNREKKGQEYFDSHPWLIGLLEIILMHTETAACVKKDFAYEESIEHQI